MCQLGLNDVIYIVPEFTPSEYDNIYTKIAQGNEYQEFATFFEHYATFDYDKKRGEDDYYGIPERMKNLFKNSMTAIERDYYEPDLRGRAFINLKHVPNGHYTIYYLRLGQPISINSRIKVLGHSSGIYVNIKREYISEDKRPQLDLNHNNIKVSKRETSKFKLLKAKALRERDNKILNLNSDDEDEE
jgi:hypothetical protein